MQARQSLTTVVKQLRQAGRFGTFSTALPFGSLGASVESAGKRVLCAATRNKSPTTNAEKEFVRADVNDDGVLTYNEFDQWYPGDTVAVAQTATTK